MAEASLITQITDWLVDQSLGEPDIVELFEGVCKRLHAIGVPVSRAMLMWSTLHPLFQAESVLWRRGEPAELGQFPHQDIITEQWLRSPMHHMLKDDVTVLRRRLTGPGRAARFRHHSRTSPRTGYTDYLVMSTDLFSRASRSRNRERRGIFVTWASRPAGRLHRRRSRRAAAHPAAARDRLQDGHPVAHLPQHRRGLSRPRDGRSACFPARSASATASIRARSSGIPTCAAPRGLPRSMPSDDFLDLLNVYFECAARPAIAAGGEVLAFVGDAVLAIFPIEDENRSCRSSPAGSPRRCTNRWC